MQQPESPDEVGQANIAAYRQRRPVTSEGVIAARIGAQMPRRSPLARHWKCFRRAVEWSMIEWTRHRGPSGRTPAVSTRLLFLRVVVLPQFHYPESSCPNKTIIKPESRRSWPERRASRRSSNAAVLARMLPVRPWWKRQRKHLPPTIPFPVILPETHAAANVPSRLAVL
jgi:hypothetical protein